MKIVTLAVCIGALALCGCSLFQPVPKAPPPVAELPPPAPHLPTPNATHKSEVDPGSDIVGYVQKTIVGKDDTLPDIARRFDVGYEEMVTANPGVDPWLPGVGKEVVVPTQFVLPAAPHEGVVVNVAAMRISIIRRTRRMSRRWCTPIPSASAGWAGRPRKVRPRSSAAKRIRCGWCRSRCATSMPRTAKCSRRWCRPVPTIRSAPICSGLQWPSYLIHGTNKPYGVGMRSSHGCIRLYPEDIAVFFDMIPIGTKVTVVNQPYLFGWRDGTLYLQAYSVMEDDSRDWSKNRKALLAKLLNPKLRKKIADHDDEIDWQRVGDLAHSPRAVPVPVTGGLGGIDEVLSQSLLVANTLPEGSNWDGQTGLLVDEKTYKEMVGGRAEAPPATQTQASVH